KTILSAEAWAYYTSASDDKITICETRAAYQRFEIVMFSNDLTHILQGVTTVDCSTTILGCNSSLLVHI
ncbi:hypothetical protein J3R83DRAFT_2549, partial [Lanmaoa asiatica]